jgi:hypothetical protein
LNLRLVRKFLDEFEDMVKALFRANDRSDHSTPENASVATPSRRLTLSSSVVDLSVALVKASTDRSVV